MDGINASIDVANMPIQNLLVFGLIVITVLIIVVQVLTKSGLSQIGPFKIKREKDGIKKEHEGQTAMHYMNEENRSTDDLMRQRIRSGTTALKTRLINSFKEYRICCAMTRRALSSAIRFPLYESIENNHFTEELMPDHYMDYRSRILRMIQDEYMDIFYAAQETSCDQDDIHPWEEDKQVISNFLDDWLKQITIEVIKCCRQKITNYNRYLPEFEQNEDTYRIAIVKACIEKNEGYIRALEKRI
jgi:hypothetical protein